MTISSLPTAPTTSDPATFAARSDALLGALPTFVTEVNAMAAAMSAIAGGTAFAIPYTFSTTTADADPGAGFLRLDNATQNLATTIRADLTGADGSVWTDVLDTFDDSTSTVKGQVMLMKRGDATKWLAFNVTALATPAGYRNIAASIAASSAATPFADGDALILKFTRTGDKGATGTVTATGDHAVTVHTGNGRGSTNTSIRRFTTTLSNVGTAITYADSATLGGSFTINEAGMYEIYYLDSYAGNNIAYGVSLNSNQLTTGIASISLAAQLMRIPDGGNVFMPISGVFRLAAGDVVRAHYTTGAALTDANDQTRFYIRKVGAA